VEQTLRTAPPPQSVVLISIRDSKADEIPPQLPYIKAIPTLKESPMSIRINDVAPDFTADSTAGTIHFHDWLDGHYAIIFSHPRDFTPVCTTEFGAVAQLAAEWAKRKTKVIGVSVDSVEDHGKWKRDIEAFAGAAANFPIIDDTSLTVAKAYDMLPAEYYLPAEGRTPANTATVRTVYIVGPDKKVRLSMTYPMSVGRNFAEILRALDAVQATDGVPFATPANWVPGQDVIVALSVSTEDAKAKYGDLDIKLPYLRFARRPV
jgi:alkyl hydroperoxide reductase subunit AhpC